MKDNLDDAPYQKRQRAELFVQWIFCILALCMLGITIVFNRLPPAIALITLTMQSVLGGTSLMYGLSRRHRQDHKQLHDMLVILHKRQENAAEPTAAASPSVGRQKVDGQ